MGGHVSLTVLLVCGWGSGVLGGLLLWGSLYGTGVHTVWAFIWVGSLPSYFFLLLLISDAVSDDYIVGWGFALWGGCHTWVLQ